MHIGDVEIKSKLALAPMAGVTGETAFILYAAVYLALGIATMLISMLIRKKTQK